jgi:hypothetical protein
VYPKKKAQMGILFWRMISMPIVQLELKFDVLKMEQTFHMGYQKEKKVLYVFPTNW